MKTLIALSTALLLSFVAPEAYAGNPDPVNKGNRHHMMTKKKKHKKNKKNKKTTRSRRNKGCDMVN